MKDMKTFMLVSLLGIALLLAGCTSNNNNPDQKPVYFVPPTATAV